MTRPSAVFGWDIGGVNTKVARLDTTAGGPAIRTIIRPYEVQSSPSDLTSTLVQLARELGAGPGDAHAITMTAELSQAFRTKRQGVGYVLDAIEAAFPESHRIHVYTVSGCFVSPADGRTRPLEVAAANWAATAAVVAKWAPTCILLDVGTTSADLIPIVKGRVVARGRTDPERLLSGELVYTGALRTPAEAVTRRVPLWGGSAAVSADGFALIGDAHLWLGRLSPEDYTCRTPDNRGATRVDAGERLARVVCADREMLDEPTIDAIAKALAEAQVHAIADALARIRERWPEISVAVVAGLGDFIAVDGAHAAGLDVLPLADKFGPAARAAPAAAVASLLGDYLRGEQ